MNLKKLPVLVLSAIVAGLPLILLYQLRDEVTLNAARFLGGMGIGAIFFMGFGMIVYQTVWKLRRTSDEDLVPQIFGVILVAAILGVLSILAILAWSPSGFLVYVLLWAAAYVFFKPFYDQWIALG